DAGIGELRDIVLNDEPGDAVEGGTYEETDITADFQAKMMSFIDPSVISSMKVVLDGSDGVGGPMVGPILDQLPLAQITINWTPDGDFPGHGPNPLLPESQTFLVKKVLSEGAALGIAWDGDADRCFIIDDTGKFVAGDFLTALLADSILAKQPGA